MNAFYEQRPKKLFIGAMTHCVFPLHVHDAAEVVILTRGSAMLSIDGIQHRLTPGDAAVIFPLIPHSFDGLSADSDGLTTIFPPDIIPEYAGTFQGLQPENPVLPACETGEDVRHAVQCLKRLRSDEDMPMCIAYLHVLLAGVLHRLTYCPAYSCSERGLGYRITHYISEHALEDITLESAAAGIGISASHLSHFFSQQMHTGFRRFINTIRIEKARTLMRDPNLTLTWICGACGYSSMRTFRRAFRKEVGCLPSEHLIALRSKVPAAEKGKT